MSMTFTLLRTLDKVNVSPAEPLSSANSDQRLRHFSRSKAPSTPATCRSNRQLVAFDVRHVERN